MASFAFLSKAAIAFIALASFFSRNVVASEAISRTFLSRPITLRPGEVYRRLQLLPWPKGHIAVRRFYGEIVSESEESVPLSDVYLHHWVVLRTSQLLNDTRAEIPGNDPPGKLWPNGGTCENEALSQVFGAGSETRRTDVSFPAPYGLESNNPSQVEAGSFEAWWVQIHAIDTRGAVSAKACLECQCAAYNITPKAEGYTGGLQCCEEGDRCAVREGYEDTPRTYYLRYTVEYVPYDECVVPLRVYVLDVTDNGKPMADSPENGCQVEYHVPACTATGGLEGCQHTRNQTFRFPDSGRIVYSLGHQHVGGLGITLWGKDDRLICDSLPIYGRGSSAGDEAGYVTGMGSCRHSDSDRVSAGEVLTLRSTYSMEQAHPGVMGLFSLAVAVDGDYAPPPNGKCARIQAKDTLSMVNGGISNMVLRCAVPSFLLGMALTALVIAITYTRTHEEPSYAPLVPAGRLAK